MTVNDTDLNKVEQRRHEESVERQSFVFDRSKRIPKTPIEEPAPRKQGKKVRFTSPEEGETSQPEILKVRQDLAEEGLSHNQSKYKNISFRGRMRPDESIRQHPAFNALYRYATEGCPVECGPSWTKEHLEAAVQRGPHISAKSEEAARCLREEAMEKVAQGEAEVIKWDDIKANPHPKLKISPLAAVPHKSRLFRAILDLSFQLRINGVLFPSVNEATVPLSDHRSMEQMGKVLWRIVAKVAECNPEDGDILFAKWDIKDGFWRLVVSEENAWNFCYVLPKINEDDPIEIVRPTCLQMGWCESPPLFCTASETARDIAQAMADQNEPLPQHPLEHFCLPETQEIPPPAEEQIRRLIRLLEVYMDDFIGLMQAPTRTELEHFTRAVLHGIHKVFPPPGLADNQEDEPIALKKLRQGDGRWASGKEILGWFFDGASRCMVLPVDKVQKITTTLKELTRKKMVKLGELEKMMGKLMHATIGIPNGRGLLSPIIATVATKSNLRRYKEKLTTLNLATRQALQDWITLLPIALKEPIPCKDLMPAPADFCGFCDASQHGAGGVWFGMKQALPPIVWRVKFPSWVQESLVSQDHPTGSISNSDLEMLGLLFQWLVLEKFVKLAHTHVACWCDNTPTVAWASKLLATKAITAARILRTLALRMMACKASPLTTLHIPGTMNKMADFASRSFDQWPEDRDFLTEFHTRFTLPQNACWISCQLPNVTIGRALALLLTPTCEMASWRRHMQRATVTGGIGANSFQPVSINTFKRWSQQKDLFSFKFSPEEFAKVCADEDNRFKPEASRQPSAPSARPLNWLGT